MALTRTPVTRPPPTPLPRSPHPAAPAKPFPLDLALNSAFAPLDWALDVVRFGGAPPL